MGQRTRLIVYYLVVVVGVLSGFVVLYNYGMATWEGRPQPLYRSIEVVVQTVTTVGYGGDAPWSSPQMNYLVSLMALSGLVLIFAALPVLVVPLFEDAFRSSAPSSVRGIGDHVVLCNYGPREEVLIDELTEREVEYVIVEGDRETANTLYTSGYTVMFGNPESDATLRSARLEHADVLIANVDDETNPSVLLSAREVNPDVRTVSLTEDPNTADYHRYAGADHVLSPKQILGEQLAGKTVGTFDPEAIEAVEIDEDFDIAELPLQSGSELIGQTIAESGIFERTGAAIIGVWARGSFQSPPPPDARFDARSVLVATGREAELDRLKEMTLSEGRHRRGDVVVATGQVELLAEVASFLHLIMYGLMCVALLVLRRQNPEWYSPSYRVPGYPVVPAVGALASFGLIAFMQPASIGIGIVVMLVSYLWYRYYAGGVTLKGDI